MNGRDVISQRKDDLGTRYDMGSTSALTSFNTCLWTARLDSYRRCQVLKNTVIAFQWIVRQISKNQNIVTETYYSLEKFENLLGGEAGLSLIKDEFVIISVLPTTPQVSQVLRSRESQRRNKRQCNVTIFHNDSKYVYQYKRGRLMTIPAILSCTVFLVSYLDRQKTVKLKFAGIVIKRPQNSKSWIFRIIMNDRCIPTHIKLLYLCCFT